MTGALWYPNADKTHRYDKVYPGAIFKTIDKAILHTTEGHGLPPYKNGATAPHMTLVPNHTLKRFTYYQHFPFNMSSRALRNEKGGVETNTDATVQFEIVGTCVKASHLKWPAPHLYTPELPAWALYDLGVMVEWFNHEHGIQLAAPTFKSYETLAPGTETVRMRNSQWNTFKGWCGHQHVPENTHLDPGRINIAAIMAHARGIREERNMPTENDIAKAVINYPIKNQNVVAEDSTTTVGRILTDMEYTIDNNNRKLSERLKTVESTQTDIILQLNEIAAGVRALKEGTN